MIDFVTIEDLRVRIGLQPDDDSQDANLEAAADATLAILETYLDRKLEYQSDEQTFFAPDRSILMRRWPIDYGTVELIWYPNGAPDPVLLSGPSLMDSVVPNSNWIDYERGIVFAWPAGVGFPLTVTWTGGFQTLPPDLLWAWWAAFDLIWASSPTWGGGSGGGSTGVAKRITLVGIGSVEFDTSATAGSTGSGSTGYDSAPWGILPINVTSVLDRYRRESVIGVG